MSDFQNKPIPPGWCRGLKRKFLSKFSGANSSKTKSSWFLVSERKRMSGTHCLISSLTRRTVMGFPRQQHLQLKMKLSLQVAEGEKETLPKHSKITWNFKTSPLKIISITVDFRVLYKMSSSTTIDCKWIFKIYVWIKVDMSF